MKKLLIPAVTVLLFSGCGDSVESVVGFSKPELRDSELDADVSIHFPKERTITDVNGRSIRVRLLAKQGNQIAFEKLPSLRRFVLPLEKLSQEDQITLVDVPDGGDLASFSNIAGRAQRGANRQAVWHSQIANAEKEALRIGLPILVAVLSGTDESSAEFEKNLVYSRDFKKWANQNVTLCLLRVGSDSREATFKTWQNLVNYGIPQSTMSSLNLISPKNSTVFTIPEASQLSASQVLQKLNNAISAELNWRVISKADSPVRESSPFRVNGGAKIIGGAT